MAANEQPITKIWTMEIKTPDLANMATSDFNSLLQEVIEFCSPSSSGQPDHGKHQFWEEDVDNPGYIVLFTGYASLSSNLEADKNYVARGFIPRMGEWVESKRLLLCHYSISKVPLRSDRLILDILDSGSEDSDAGLTWQASELVTGEEKRKLKVHIVSTPKQGTLPVKSSSAERYILRRRA